MQALGPRARAKDATAPDHVRAAFREVHGRRLHGFAILLTLGDAPGAARLTADAIAAGAARVDELRHPERAAAWLRARIVRFARGTRPGERRPTERMHVLAQLGVDGAVAAGLTALGHLERAALIAATVERLDRRDVAVIVGRDGQALDRLLARARQRYAAAHARSGTPATSGAITDRVRAVAMRAMG